MWINNICIPLRDGELYRKYVQLCGNTVILYRDGGHIGVDQYDYKDKFDIIHGTNDYASETPYFDKEVPHEYERIIGKFLTVMVLNHEHLIRARNINWKGFFEDLLEVNDLKAYNFGWVVDSNPRIRIDAGDGSDTLVKITMEQWLWKLINEGILNPDPQLVEASNQ